MGACFTRATDHAWKTTKRFCSLFYSLSLSLLRPNFMSKNMCPQCNRHNNHFRISFVRRKFMDHERKKKTGRSVRTDFLSNENMPVLIWASQKNMICCNSITAEYCINAPCMATLVTWIVEVLRIAVMGSKFFHVMVPLEDMVKFMDANMVQIRVLVCQV